MRAEHDIVLATPPVYLSVRLSHFGIVSKWMHISSHSNISPERGMTSFSSATTVTKSDGNPFSEIWGGKIWQILSFISKTVRDRPIVTIEHK